jgi:hypothetical protein
MNVAACYPEVSVAERRYNVRMRKALLITAGIVVLFARIFQMELEKNTERVENIKVSPEVDSQSVSKIGYIFEVRTKSTTRTASAR